MIVLVRVVAGVLLLAHGLVHLLYLAQDVPEFSIEESWLVPESARPRVALALIAATIAGFAVLALAVWGVPGLSMAWPILASSPPRCPSHCSSRSGTPGWYSA